MTPKSASICPGIWSGLRNLFPAGIPASVTPPSSSRPMPEGDDNSLGHGSGVDDDLPKGSTGAQQAGEDARDNASDTTLDDAVKACPNCKVAIVIGHSSSSQGAHPPPMGIAEWTYNDDIAKRTVKLLTSQSGGKVEAKIFYRVTAGGYSREMATVYAQVNKFLAEVPSQKRIAIELHYNSVTSPSARYAEVLYKGDISFAQNSARLMAAIFGGKNHTKPYGQNPRGQATFTNGPTNTYLMEPFFGSNAASAAIAMTENGKQKLAEAYATSLMEWIR